MKEHNQARMAEAVLDAAMLEKMRALTGTDLRIGHSVNNEVATRLAVERFADAIGDPNELWRNAKRAQTSPFGAPVAPPSFVMGCFSGLQFGWPGLGSFHSSTDLQFHKPVYVGDTVTATCRYDGFDGPRASSFAEVMVTNHFHNSYRNQHDELVAEIDWDMMHFMRQKAKQSDKSKTVEPHQWTEPEVEAIEKEILAEEARGLEPRWWDDVEIGDTLDQIIKGPIGMTDEVAYVAAGGPPIPRVAANAVALRQYQRHPAWAFRDPATMALEPTYAVHYNKAAANAMGVALQYDVGFQRQCWHIHLLTHWMGDHAWICRANAEYRRFVYHGDVVRLGGQIVAKSIEPDGQATVRVRTWAHNQHDQDVMPGGALIALPRRGQPAPVESRLRALDHRS